MSKIVNQLRPEDFGKSFDIALFSEWKKSIEAHEKAGIIQFVLTLIGFAALMLLRGLLGVGLFFIFLWIGIGINLAKQKKRKKYQNYLGIDNSELKEAIAKCRERIK